MNNNEQTLSIIKPDAVERNKIGEITAMLEAADLRIVASKRIKLDQEKAAAFYGVHADKPFFQSLCDFMCSGPIVVQVLEGENAIQRKRTFSSYQLLGFRCQGLDNIGCTPITNDQ